LVEAIAFGHDVGHAPFGHAGEKQIDAFLNGLVPLPREVQNRFSKPEAYSRELGACLSRDFKHNCQSVRILSLLEPYSASERDKGLNLTFQTLSGVLQHTKVEAITDSSRRPKYPDADHVSFAQLLDTDEFQSVESLVVAISDEIAQVVHDLCNAVRIGALSEKELLEKASPTGSVITKRSRKYRGKKIVISTTGSRDEQISQFCSASVHLFAAETSTKIAKQLRECTPKETVSSLCARIGTRPWPAKEFRDLLRFKDDLVVNNFSVNRMDNKGRYIIRQLFKTYVADLRQLPDSVLAGFTEMKRKELEQQGSEYFQDWFKRTSEQFGIEKLDETQQRNILKVIEDDDHGNGMRRAPHELVHSLVPFIACDTDYLRAVADYVASMTDRYAETEFVALYK
jgi:dGTPase